MVSGCLPWAHYYFIKKCAIDLNSVSRTNEGNDMEQVYCIFSCTDNSRLIHIDVSEYCIGNYVVEIVLSFFLCLSLLLDNSAIIFFKSFRTILSSCCCYF